MSNMFDWNKNGGKSAGGGLTLRGWLQMYTQQTSVSQEETWRDLWRLGYDRQLEPRDSVPWNGKDNADLQRSHELVGKLKQMEAEILEVRAQCFDHLSTHGSLHLLE